MHLIPRLKYQPMGGDVPALLLNDSASCIAVSANIIAVGTHGGTVHILDFLGNQVKEFRYHAAPVNDLSFDIEGECTGSCSDDGSVIINSLSSDDDEKMKFDYHLPIKALSLDPDYAKKQSKRFVAGDLSGHLYIDNSKVVHSGEGPISCVRWRGSLVAWANDVGVKVYDTDNDQRVTCIERSPGSREALHPHLVWEDDTLLLIGWGTSVKLASIKSDQQNQVDIVASFETSYFISGIAPFGESLAILAYIPPTEDDGKEEFISTTSLSSQGHQVRVVSRNGNELTMDPLPVHGFEHREAKDYSLAHSPFIGSSYAGDEPLFYIVTPKEVLTAKPRDVEDHFNWLFHNGFIEEAIAAVDAWVAQTKSVEKDNVSTKNKSYTCSDGDEATSKLMEEHRRAVEVMEVYWRQLKESGGFDIEGIELPPEVRTYGGGYMIYNCHEHDTYSFPELVHRYARLGLHRYNILEGTNFELDSIVKFNKSWTIPISSYLFTLNAFDGPTYQVFQARVNEESYGNLDVVVSIARPKGTTTHPDPPIVYQDEEDMHQGRLPSWPSDFSDSRRFYALNDTEISANRWIFLYFQLAICGDDRFLREDALATFTLVDVVVETNDVQHSEERLNAKNIILYISYTYLGVDEKAIVRRDLTAQGKLSLRGVCIHGLRFTLEGDALNLWNRLSYYSRGLKPPPSLVYRSTHDDTNVGHIVVEDDGISGLQG